MRKSTCDTPGPTANTALTTTRALPSAQGPCSHQSHQCNSETMSAHKRKLDEEDGESNVCMSRPRTVRNQQVDDRASTALPAAEAEGVTAEQAPGAPQAAEAHARHPFCAATP